jgi:Rrf2 family protein
MKFIKRDTDYAFQALVFLAKNKRAFTVEQIATELNLPMMHLRKIFRILSSEGILNSTKGRSGGFVLNIDPATISMAQIFKIFQGKIDLTNCLVNKETCQNIPECVLRKKLKEISLKLEKELEDIKLCT